MVWSLVRISYILFQTFCDILFIISRCYNFATILAFYQAKREITLIRVKVGSSLPAGVKIMQRPVSRCSAEARNFITLTIHISLRNIACHLSNHYMIDSCFRCAVALAKVTFLCACQVRRLPSLWIMGLRVASDT